MIRLFLKSFIVFFVFFTLSSYGNNLSTAERLYQNGDFEASLDIYMFYLDEHPTNFSLLYNIGNCHFKLKQYGQAILYYRKALKIEQNNADAINNLTLARSFLPVFTKSNNSFSANILGWFNVITLNFSYFLFMFILLIFNGALFYVLKYKKNELIINVIYSTLVLVLFSGGLLTYKMALSNRIEAVIIAKKIPVHEGPSLSLPQLFFIHEGSEVNIKKELSEWVEIELDNGFNGWIERIHLTKI
ncbi:MAG: hypothetical protein CMP39_00245 [Rickettsiales bacterium]|nr:hypothetical protein [Rickettsiales bacterium]|tara:strand:+ start:5758 stop:6492 length:735 start_codon:yes stop_codon:yes gene_type:complete